MINISDYKIRVYVDSIEGWQRIDSDKFELINGDKAVVATKNNTTVRRLVKFVESDADIVADGCIYLIKKPI